MNKLPYLVFLLLFFIPFLSKNLGVLPRSASLIYEIFAGVIFLVSLIYCAVHKRLLIGPKYIILFLIVCLYFSIGIVVNSVEAGTVISGLRNYIKYMPLFLLPVVYSFSDDEIKGQLKFLVAFGIFQFPFVLHQAFVLNWTPDLIAGTLGLGTTMSIYLACCIVVLGGFYYYGRISPPQFFIVALLLFIPTTLNESKGTIVLMLVGFLVLALNVGLMRGRNIILISAVASMLLIFTFVYNQSFEESGEGNLIEFYTDLDKGIGYYLYSGDAEKIDPGYVLEPSSNIIGALPSIDDEYRIGRLDALVLPFRVLSKDPMNLLIGLGIGNASDSSIPIFRGKYPHLAGLNVSQPAVPVMIWEIGLVGLFLYMTFFYFIYTDSIRLISKDSIGGVLALGWAGVVPMFVLALFYKNYMQFELLGALFWYFSGYVVSKKYQI